MKKVNLSKLSHFGIETYTFLLSVIKPGSKFNEFEPRLKSSKNRFQLSAGLNLEKLNTILSGTNHIYSAAQILEIRPLLYLVKQLIF